MIARTIAAQNAGLVYGDTMVAETDEFLVNRTARAMPNSLGDWTYTMDQSTVPAEFTVDAAADALESDGGFSLSYALCPDLTSPDQFAEFEILEELDVANNAFGIALRHTVGGGDHYWFFRAPGLIQVSRFFNYAGTFLFQVAAVSGVVYQCEVFGDDPVTIRLREKGDTWTEVQDSDPSRITTGNRAGFFRRNVNGTVGPIPDWKRIRWGRI